jgi:hypothetical protein
MPTDKTSKVTNEVKEGDSLRRSPSPTNKAMRELTGSHSTVPGTPGAQWFRKTAADIMRPKNSEENEEVQSNRRENKLHEKYIKYIDMCQRLGLSKQTSSDIAIKAMGLNKKDIVAYPAIIDLNNYNEVIDAIENIDKKELIQHARRAYNNGTDGPDDIRNQWVAYANALAKIAHVKDEGPDNASILEAVQAFRAITNNYLNNPHGIALSWRNLTEQADFLR